MGNREITDFFHADDLGGLELLRARYRHQCFARHVHESYCIGVIERGVEEFYRSGGNHVASRGAIIVVNADEVHTGHAATENGWAYRAMKPLPELFDRVCRELEGPGAGRPYFTEPVLHDPELAAQLLWLYRFLERSNDRLERETRFLSAMVALVQRHGRRRADLPALRGEPRAVRRVKDYLGDRLSENPSLDELARLVDLNPYYLARLFRKTLGLPPHAYLLQLRVEGAKRLIRTGLPLAAVAASVGFSDQSHLSRHFKRVLGATPGQYARSVGRVNSVQ